MVVHVGMNIHAVLPYHIVGCRYSLRQPRKLQQQTFVLRTGIQTSGECAWITSVETAFIAASLGYWWRCYWWHWKGPFVWRSSLQQASQPDGLPCGSLVSSLRLSGGCEKTGRQGLCRGRLSGERWRSLAESAALLVHNEDAVADRLAGEALAVTGWRCRLAAVLSSEWELSRVPWRKRSCDWLMLAWWRPAFLLVCRWAARGPVGDRAAVMGANWVVLVWMSREQDASCDV
jgi:hypothetical protein